MGERHLPTLLYLKDYKENLDEVFMYIITGGAGMIGSAVIWALNQRGIYDILVIDNLASTPKWKNLVNLRYTDYIHRDNFLEQLFQHGENWDVQGIVHMGACSSTTETNADFLMENNFHYTKDLQMWAQMNNVRFVNASSAATYGDGSHGFSDDIETCKKLQPLNMYGYSKQLFDLHCIRTESFEKTVNLKFFNVYGPNEYHKENMRSVVCKSVPQIQAEGKICLFASDRADYADGGQMRDFVYVKDCAQLITWFLLDTEETGIFNVGTGEARTWNDLARAMFKALDKEENIEYIAMPDNLKGKYQYFTEADMSWHKRLNCPVTFTPLEEGVREYVQEYLLRDSAYLSSL